MTRWLIGVFLLGAAAFAADWRRYRSPNFELFSDSREAVSRRVLERLERIRHVFLDTVGPRGAPIPVRVFLFESERDFRVFLPNSVTRGFYQNGPDRDFIAMHNDDEQTMRVVFHEYVHLVQNHSVAALPGWLKEGTAEFYSTLHADGDRLTVGIPVLSHLRLLSGNRWIDARALATATKDSPYYNESDKAGLFYAQSWALVHMMNLAPEYRRNMPQFVDLVGAGTPAELAFEKAFSKSLNDGLGDAARWIRQPRMPVLSLVWKPPDAVEIEAESLPAYEAEVARVELLLRLGRHSAAADRLRRLERHHSDVPAVLSALAMFEMGAGRKQEALKKFELAIQAGDVTASTSFEYAMLLRETGAPRERVRALLSEAVGRNPKHAEAHFLLGLMAQQDGEARAAAASFEQAVEVLPGQSYFWHALAMAYHSLQRSSEARLAARRAVITAANAQQREMASAALRLTSSARPPEPAPPRAPTVTPKSWQMPQGDSRVEGILEHIDCLGANARFHIRSGGKTVVLFVDNPGQVLLKTPSSLTFEFSCGAQKPRRVVVEYLSKPNAARRTEGDITAIEFP